MDWSIDDVQHLISEDAGFRLVRIYTDKFISDESFGGGEIFDMIQHSKEPGINVAYVDGETFSTYATKAAPPKPSSLNTPEGIDDADEFAKSDMFCGVLFYYTGTVSEPELIEAFINMVKTQWGYNHDDDEWQNALRWE